MNYHKQNGPDRFDRKLQLSWRYHKNSAPLGLTYSTPIYAACCSYVRPARSLVSSIGARTNWNTQITSSEETVQRRCSFVQGRLSESRRYYDRRLSRPACTCSESHWACFGDATCSVLSAKFAQFFLAGLLMRIGTTVLSFPHSYILLLSALQCM